MAKKMLALKAVLFDFDGTLTRPGALDFAAIKRTIGCPLEIPILEFIENLPTQNQRQKALQTLDQFEMEAAAKSKPNQNVEKVLPWLRSQDLRLGVISRNSLGSIKRTLQNFKQIKAADFNVLISRDDPARPKPHPDGVILAAQMLGVKPQEILVVGDYIFDIQAGKNAGATTVLLDNHTPNPEFSRQSDYTISDVDGLAKIVRQRLPLPPGKLPNDLLHDFLAQFPINDPSLLIRPGVGEDTAAIGLENSEVLILKSDPITFVSEAIGNYAVIINANDIATSGATPRWFLTTLLFPDGTTAHEIGQVMQDIQSVCARCKITLCGGHTEITDAVRRPVVTGMLVGTVAKDDLIDKRRMRKGDRILLTKGVAVEGTAILAREFGTRLRDLGMAQAEIDTCRDFLSNISILDEARLAGGPGEITAMHDVTEGGLATAVEELSTAGQHKIRIQMDKIPFYAQTERICRLLGIAPLGLIGSGSLLIACKKDGSHRVEERIRKAGIDVACIGQVLEAGRGIQAVRDNQSVAWPRFEVDELARLFAKNPKSQIPNSK